MSEQVSLAKICQVCRKDVTRHKRVKDPNGNYCCEACYAARQPGKEANPSVARASPVPKKPEASPCPNCQRALAPGAVLCVACGYNLRSGKQVTTSVKKEVDWKGWLSYVPVEIFLILGGVALFALIGLLAPKFTDSPNKIIGFSLIFIPLIIMGVGSNKCRRILVDEHGWSETLFRIPILRNFVFLGGLFSVPRLLLITLRYGAAAAVCVVAGILMLPMFVHADPDDHGWDTAGPVQVAHAKEFSTPPVFAKMESGTEVARLTCEAPDQGTRQLWIFRPAGSHAEKSLPCLLVTPGNLRMIFGVSLEYDDPEEYEEYVKQGFVVVVYSLDGIEEGKPDASEEETFNDAVRAIKAFKASNGGLANAQQALDYVSKNLPEVDPQRLYAFGGGSGGSVALRFAAAEPRISAVYALGPITDVTNRPSDEGDLAKLTEQIPDIRDFVREVSPITHVGKMRTPIFIYQPGLDFLDTKASVEAYCKTLTDAGLNVTYLLGPSDLATLMKEEVPPGITWLKGPKDNPNSAATAPAAATAPTATPTTGP
jgi:dienelactone hydrolase